MATIALACGSTSSVIAPELMIRLTRAVERSGGDNERFVQIAAYLLRSGGYRVIARGAYGCAGLSSDGSAVVKAYGADKGYRAFLEIIKEFPRNPYLPRIYERLDLDEESGVVVMEPLPRTILQVSAEPDMRRTLAIYWKARRYYYSLVDAVDLQAPPRGLPSVRLPKRLQEVIDRCAEVVTSGKFNVTADLHGNNAMVRSDGTLVLIDPIAGY